MNGKLERGGDEGREIPQLAEVSGVEQSRSLIGDAQRANPMAVEVQRRTGIEPHSRWAGDDRAVGDARVERGVGNLHHVGPEDRVGTKRLVAR